MAETGAEASNRLHLDSDVDSSSTALHHTLGSNANQSSPGNHLHDERYSNISHNHDTDYTPIDKVDVGSVNIISEGAPTTRPDGQPLKVGDFWTNSSIKPSVMQIASYFWNTDAPVTTTPSAQAGLIATWAKAVWTAPSAGTIVLTLNGRVDSSGAGPGQVGDNIRVWTGHQINGGPATVETEAGWAEVYQPFAGRFITAIYAANSFTVNAEDQVKFFPMAGASRASAWLLGFVVMRLQFFPAAQHARLVGAT